MKFQKAIVTSGPTREWLDPVRYISNASSGKMGFNIANELIKLIPNLVYIRGGVLERYSEVKGARNKEVDTTIDLRNSILEELDEDTIVVMAAAPADFRPIMTAKNKIKKSKSEGLLIEFEQNPDVLASLNNIIKENNWNNTILVGFAAETEKLEENALGKLQRKGLTYIVGNYVGNGSGFGEVNTGIRIYSSKGMELEIQNESKESISGKIVNFLKEKLEF
ncbi:MAG: phosphopantothenoylcysteine decarboxylase [Leptospiraceae bacterium]|nr:phosphopantothenoylcysteine decarboxylase [Leptospiraceae bacterium]